MKWNILNKSKNPEEIVQTLLGNRGLKSKEDIQEFLVPPDPSTLSLERLGVNKIDLKKAIAYVRSKIKGGEPIVVYGDYDADGICATAIFYEALKNLGAKVMPFIPLREKEGYGLSKEGIDSIISDPKYNLSTLAKVPRSHKAGKKGLIISVDSGIVANVAVDYAKEKGVDIIIIDHHEKGEKFPNAAAIVHTQELCAAGISYLFCKELLTPNPFPLTPSLELAAIATVTDLMPLVGPNRSLVKYGLELLNKTTRPGLRALFSVAGIEKVGTYEIGFMIGPRINASGRIENALLALRLLCTNDFSKALEYARELNDTNRQRQEMMEEMTTHALLATSSRSEKPLATSRIIVIEHESYHQGIIGLIAGKLVDKYYLPAIVISKGEIVSKASARSISGFNIIEAIRASSILLLGAGGHPMAAGFSIETVKIEEFKAQISALAAKQITDDMLDRILRIDCELNLGQINMDLYQKIRQFEPFGLGNPEPTFAAEVLVQNTRTVGQDGKHLKLMVDSFDAIAFNQGSLIAQIKVGAKINIAYIIDLNTYNRRQNLQLKIKDIKL